MLLYLQHADAYDLKEAAAACRTAGVKAGEAYLCERMGNVAGAMDIHVEAVEEANSKLHSQLVTRPVLVYSVDASMVEGLGGEAARKLVLVKEKLGASTKHKS